MNTFAIAKDGTNAEITCMDGEKHDVRYLWSRLVDFVQRPIIDHSRGVSYTGLPNGIVDELDRSFQDPEIFYQSSRDSSGITSVDGFYRTGVGTLSQWMKRREKELKARGYSEQDAIKDIMQDVGRNSHQHIKSTDKETLERMYV